MKDAETLSENEWRDVDFGELTRRILNDLARREGVAAGEGGGRGETLRRQRGPEAREDSILALQRKRFEAGLTKPRGGLSAEGRMKRRDRILESVGRLKEKHSKVARHLSTSHTCIGIV